MFGLALAPGGTDAGNDAELNRSPFLVEETQLPQTYPEIDDEESDELDEAAMNQLLEQHAEKELAKLRLEHEERMKEASEKLKKLKADADAEAERNRQLELERAEQLKKKEAAKKTKDDALKKMLETKLNEFLQIERLKLQAQEKQLQMQISTIEAGLPGVTHAGTTFQPKTPEPHARVPPSPALVRTAPALPNKNDFSAGAKACSAAVCTQPRPFQLLNQKAAVRAPTQSEPSKIMHADAPKQDTFAQPCSFRNHR